MTVRARNLACFQCSADTCVPNADPGINAHDTERSDFAVAEVIMYNRVLTVIEREQASSSGNRVVLLAGCMRGPFHSQVCMYVSLAFN